MLLKLPDDEPRAAFYTHEWGGKEFVCLGDDCPLCEIGDDPVFRAIMEPADIYLDD